MGNFSCVIHGLKRAFGNLARRALGMALEGISIGLVEFLAGIYGGERRRFGSGGC